MTLDQFVPELLKRAAERGIAPAEVYYVTKEGMEVTTRDGAIENYQASRTAGLSLRGMVRGRMGYAATQVLDEAAMEMLIGAVLESASLVENEEPQEIFAGSPEYPEIETLSPALDAMSVDEQIALALRVEKEAVSLHPKVTQLEQNGLSYTKAGVRLINSFGLDLSYEDNGAHIATYTVARDGEKTSVGEAFAVTRDLAGYDVADHVRRAVETAVDMLGAESLPSGPMPVILDREVVGSFLGVFAGAFSAENAQQGLSLLAGKEGETIAAACVTLMDDPLLAGGHASRAFDDEGVATKTKPVIEDGVLRTLLHNLKTAKKQGVETTGNASRAGYTGPVRVAPSNFYLKPGSQSLQELFNQMGDGLYVTEISGLHAGADAVSGDFSLLSKGFRIEQGQRTQAVEQITVAGNFFIMLREILALGDDLRFDRGRIAGPSAYVKSLSIGGK